MPTAILLHDIRSAHNVGSIFRTADAAGVGAVYLSGVTPAPKDRFGRAQKEIAKVALGAEKTMPWEYSRSPRVVIKKLRASGYAVIGVEQDKLAKDYRRFRARKPVLYIFGNEVKGLPAPVRSACDDLLEIPMRGQKESLNVAVAAGVILFSAISS